MAPLQVANQVSGLDGVLQQSGMQWQCAVRALCTDVLDPANLMFTAEDQLKDQMPKAADTVNVYFISRTRKHTDKLLASCLS